MSKGLSFSKGEKKTVCGMLIAPPHFSSLSSPFDDAPRGHEEEFPFLSAKQ